MDDDERTRPIHTTIRAKDEALFEKMGMAPAEVIRMAADYARKEMQPPSVTSEPMATSQDPQPQQQPHGRYQDALTTVAQINAEAMKASAANMQVGMGMVKGILDMVQNAVASQPILQEGGGWNDVPAPVQIALLDALKGKRPAQADAEASKPYRDVGGKMVE